MHRAQAAGLGHIGQAASTALAAVKRCGSHVGRHDQVRLEVCLYFDELRAVLNSREAEILAELDSRGGQKVSPSGAGLGLSADHSTICFEALRLQLGELDSQRKKLASVVHGISSCSEFTASVLAHTIDDAVALFSTKRVRTLQWSLRIPCSSPRRIAMGSAANRQRVPRQVLSRRMRHLMKCPLDFEPVDDTKMSFERSHRDALLPVLRQVRE